MTDDANLYAALGLTDDASANDVADAYRRVGPSAAATDAYDVLRDATRRRAYDDTRRARARAASAASRADHRVAPGKSEVELPLTFEQAALGTTATVHIPTESPCPPCGGSGLSATDAAECPKCSGAGARSRESGGVRIRYTCDHCGGSGRLPPRPCDACGASGVTFVEHDVSLRVPAGVEDGTRLRFHTPARGGGHETVAVVRVAPHPYFARSGRDLVLKLPVTLAEAALGAVVTVPTLGGAIAVRLPPGTPHGRTLRVRGRGIPDAPEPGDLLVNVEVAVPKELSEAQRRALEAFAAATPSPRNHFHAVSPNRADPPQQD